MLILMLVGTRSSVGNKPAGGTLQEALRYASPSGAGGCVAPVTQEAWLALYELAEEKGEHVRFDWNADEPPLSMRDGRAAAAPLALQLNWPTLFSYRFLGGKHINLLESESLISLLGRVTLEGVCGKRFMVLTGGFTRGLWSCQ